MRLAWVWILGWLLSAFAFAGNSFVIFLIASIQRLHCPTNWLLFSLSWADLGVSLVMFPVDFLCELDEGCHEVTLAIFKSSFLYASVTNLCTLTMDRYVAIAKPFKYMSFQSKTRVIGFVCASWAVPLVFCLVPLTFIYTKHAQTAMLFFTFPALILFEILPPIVLLLITVHMMIIARKHRRETAAMINQLQYNQAGRADKIPSSRHTGRGRSSITFIASIVIFFILCYAFSIGVTCCQIFELCTAEPAVNGMRRVLMVANSGFNPLAYAFLKHDIKKEVKKLLRFTSGDERDLSQFRVEVEQR